MQLETELLTRKKNSEVQRFVTMNGDMIHAYLRNNNVAIKNTYGHIINSDKSGKSKYICK
jgi:hypothetical protein